jgi:hypothetical protein
MGVVPKSCVRHPNLWERDRLAGEGIRKIAIAGKLYSPLGD